ncbi:hypothetical protein LIER_42441 [Lithospermum erythrorhizon]|uniref:Uncharacterized protein n=1 Tax=Lithospermum erythrorhizon TaxID=34254 RepID=A0AAV3RPP8_LITER
MRCKTHITDNTSSIGVCASCLHHRLLPLLSTRHLQTTATRPHLLLPRSVSPYIPHRKSTTTTELHHHQNYQSFPAQKFFSTPQIGPNGVIIDDQMEKKKKKKKRGKFAIFSNLFKFRTGKRVAESEEAMDSVEESGIKSNMKINQTENCVISSSKYSENEYLDDNYRVESNKYVLKMKNSGGRRSDISRNEFFDDNCRVESKNDGRRSDICRNEFFDDNYRVESKNGGRRSDSYHNKFFEDNYRVESKNGERRSDSSRNVSGIGFWMSPLVSKRRDWGRKGGEGC